MTDLSTSSDQLATEAVISANGTSEGSSTTESTPPPMMSEASRMEAA
jgi:hypothetical protein